MKTLYLLRHAKSSWDDRGLHDIDRPLKRRGKRDCRLVGAALLQMPFAVDAVFCSPAKRARMTVKRVLETVGQAQTASGQVQTEWQVDDDLYTFDATQVMHYIRWLDNNLERVLIVGHNPAFTELVNDLTDEYLDNLPTCGFAEIQFDVKQWRQLAEGGGQLAALITPKMLREKKFDHRADLYR